MVNGVKRYSEVLNISVSEIIFFNQKNMKSFVTSSIKMKSQHVSIDMFFTIISAL